MSDIIQLLPDNIANQIAAGEVVQRPSNIVKELLENAIDANANKISVIIEQGGKQLIQVVDNGQGMSQTDARLCFERHATSKIKTSEDIFNITTMGFRGEALASIAAVACVILKTKMAKNPVGTLIEIENSKFKQQEPTMCADGTNISVKNLFFSIPARKHFLKSDKREIEYIIEEFLRIAIPFHHITFELSDNGKIVYQLPATNAKNRILQIYKNYYKEDSIINLQESYENFSFQGFLGKPAVARNVRGHQFFFINNRFVKNSYLGHAVSSVYENLISKESFPTYFINIKIDPQIIDINIHPSKQEVKFQNEKIVYSFLHAAIKLAFSKYALVPNIDFDLGAYQNSFHSFHQKPTLQEHNKTIQSPLYQGFTKPHQAHYIEKQAPQQNWKDFFEPINTPIDNHSIGQSEQSKNELFLVEELKKENWLTKNYIQFEKEYLITSQHDKLVLIHQQLAHQIILYEKYQHLSSYTQKISEPLLFPLSLQLSPEDKNLMLDLLPYFNELGYVIQENPEDVFMISTIPMGSSDKEISSDIEKIIDAYKNLRLDTSLDKKEKLIRCMSLKNSIKVDTVLSQEEMRNLVNQLFLCKNPFYTYGNMRAVIFIDKHKIDQLF